MIEVECGWCRSYPCECRRETRCVCGGVIVSGPAGVEYGVRLHQRTPRHAAWRRVNGL